jgi:IS4 transposase
MTRVEALRWWRAGYQAGHQAAEHEQQAAARWDHLAASYRAQRAADQQAKIDALLLETIDALARLLASHDNGKS